MNQASDVNLAVAIHKAGAFSSISAVNFYSNKQADYLLTENELKRFQDLSGTNKTLLGLTWAELLDPIYMEMLDRLSFKYIEVYHLPMEHPQWPNVDLTVSELRKKGFKVFFKVQKGIRKTAQRDAVIIKGKEGAGRSSDEIPPLTELFSNFKEKHPSIPAIPSGGISTSEQVKFYIDQGAHAVGIGTLFAASEESSVSYETKMKIVESSSADLKRVGRLGHQGLYSSKFENNIEDKNHIVQLYKGIRNPNEGCIYVGQGVDNIKSIMPVKDIIENLVKDLDGN